jgi:hypothetical protein
MSNEHVLTKGVFSGAPLRWSGSGLHRSLQSTERYTAKAAARFKDFWRD